MKTQIENLINGAKKVIRDNGHKKYISAKSSTSHEGYAGSSYELRNEIARRVYEENGDTLHVIVRGVELTLDLSKSGSGNPLYWCAEITEEQYRNICPTSIGVGAKLSCYLLMINYDCTVNIQTFHRSNDRQSWKLGYTHNIDEAFVKIL